MDSRFLRNTVLVSLLFMITIFGIVLYSNGLGPGQKQDVPTVVEKTAEVILEGQIGDDLYGWMEDETFFDEEDAPEKEQEGESLSLIATSVEKDLRIQIVDERGKTVEGQFFRILLNGTDEYKDLDRDGVIYIGQLDAGEYQVSLMEKEGFVVPALALPVKVKSRVEYVAIGDISLLIKTEKEVDAMAEDGESEQALAEAAGTTEILTRENAVFGIDVSRWNENINWAKVKEEGVGFAIIRAGYRGSVTGSLVEDYYFKRNIEGAIQAGIPVGVYFFTQATNQVEAVEEASMVLTLCQDYQLTYPIFIDTEGAGGEGRADKLDAKTRTAVCEAFCETIRNSGHQAGIYASKNWFNDRLDTSRLPDNITIWLAEYADAPTYEKKYHMWQYSSSGRILGIEGRVDLNLSFLDIGKKE
ncbi:MAG: glycoside hydrolase family 25 protein [Lachnospiraceae bacterium]